MLIYINFVILRILISLIYIFSFFLEGVKIKLIILKDLFF